MAGMAPRSCAHIPRVRASGYVSLNWLTQGTVTRIIGARHGSGVLNNAEGIPNLDRTVIGEALTK